MGLNMELEAQRMKVRAAHARKDYTAELSTLEPYGAAQPVTPEQSQAAVIEEIHRGGGKVTADPFAGVTRRVANIQEAEAAAGALWDGSKVLQEAYPNRPAFVQRQLAADGFAADVNTPPRADWLNPDRRAPLPAQAPVEVREAEPAPAGWPLGSSTPEPEPPKRGLWGGPAQPYKTKPVSDVQRLPGEKVG